jgi:phage tail-like protein
MKNIVFIIAAFLLFASAAFAQGSVEGTITDAKGAAVARAVVSLVDAKGTTVAKYTADAEGYYTLDDIDAGTYKLVVNAGGFKVATKTNVLVVDDGLTVIDLTLVVNTNAGSGGSPVTSPWPQPKFSFSVEFTVGGKTSKFYAQEVAGLEQTNEIEYRHGNDKVFSTVIPPGLIKAPDVTLKKGFGVKDDTFFKWDQQQSRNDIVRGTVVINLLDEKGGTTMSWTLTNAFPKKLTGINRSRDAFETVVIAHDGLTIKK